MGRPRKGIGVGKGKSIWFSPEALEIIERGGYQSNLSAFIDALVKSTSDDSPEILKIKIMDLSKKYAKAQELTNTIHTELLTLQARLNLYKAKGDTVGAARNEVLAKYWEIVSKDRLKGDWVFDGWLTGPANVHYIKEAGFTDARDALAWCKAQERRAP
jgi:hypothetical protein